ncbi:MAG TPA: class I SAM-dependent methyltransferase [Balneolaceae bacterium]
METSTKTNLFTEKSEAYAKYRPGYPAEAINAILDPFKAQKTIKIIDIGAGTGIASRLMAERGALVTAIEPNGSMIASARSHERVNYIQARAECTPVDTNSADIVTSFQAFHWFNFKKSLKEFNRILKPGGKLALVWNYWDVRDTFTASYAELINDAARKNPSRIEPYEGFPGKLKKQRMRLLWKFRYLPFFKNVQRKRFKLHQNMELDALIGCAKSQSYLVHEGPEWIDLVENIKKLHSQNAVCRLTYNINVFLATPVK